MSDDAPGSGGPVSEKPAVEVPAGAPGPYLDVDDVAVGEGTEAVRGSTAVVHYVGVAHSTGAQFDASWDRAEPFSFTLGKREVIAGWDKGVSGMRVGGRRRLVVPPHLGYGGRGVPGVIAAGETLVFVVDLLDVR